MLWWNESRCKALNLRQFQKYFGPVVKVHLSKCGGAQLHVKKVWKIFHYAICFNNGPNTNCVAQTYKQNSKRKSGKRAPQKIVGILGPSGTPGSATPVLDFDSWKVGSTSYTQLDFQEATHLPCPGWVCGVIKQQTFATGIFKTELMSFVDKSKKWMPSHFWSSHS